tara:strand:- start:2517 stop:2756 length:240 start_codon:yes stop_codon:yes gene_type:complete
MSVPEILQTAYDLKHQLDNSGDKANTYVDGVETQYSAYERVQIIIKFLEYCNFYPASGIQNYDSERAGKEAYGNVIIED